ncbi:schlafen-like protein 1 [Notechis scutatus]|uniref:Schlafen-like protein 1 n=1 Tax=Notechis scutatus TaxID=8663 RepID=A0A6J1UW76_9SAUR|nr:schlafen-like protein 1 [Notechis scutatus]
MEMDVIPEIVVEAKEVAGNVDQVPEAALEEAKAEKDHSGQTQTYLLYVGNLNPKHSSEDLCSMLKDTLSMASVTLQRYDIEVIKKRKQAYAFVQVATEISLEQVLKQLLLASEAEHNLSKELVQKGKNLVVGQGKKPAPATRISRESDSMGSRSDAILGGSSGPERRKPLPNDNRANPLRKSVRYPWRLVDWPVTFLNSTRSDSAIVQREIVGRECLFYGAFIGGETRNVEFKQGSGEYLTTTLKHHLRKYTCAFLNSEGGSLFVGVEDNGLVRGVKCDHKEEDRIRLLTDSLLKTFKPQVFPTAYTLSFVPVIKAEDTGIFLKVIRLSVHPPKPHAEPLLYETDQGEVYLRRDGSIQGPLSGSAIQEWCRQKWTQEIKKLEVKTGDLLKEKENLQQQIRSQSNSMKCCVIL